jgi:hypothetical protein
MGGVFVVKYGYHKEVKMNRPLIAMFACCAAIALASSAAARTVTVDSLAGTSATVTVGPGEATEYLGLAYGNTDGYANPGVGWDAIASLAAVLAADKGHLRLVENLTLKALVHPVSHVWGIGQ